MERFGVNAAPGVEGEVRTARLLEVSLLPALPAARLVNGVRWPGTKQADIDHVIIAGDRIAVVDSKLWQDAVYSWDNVRLLKDGVRKENFKLIAAVDALRMVFPNFRIEGWVVVHSPSGELNRPCIVTGGDPWKAGSGVALVTAAQLPGSVYSFLSGGARCNVVDVPALAHLLSCMVR